MAKIKEAKISNHQMDTEATVDQVVVAVAVDQVDEVEKVAEDATQSPIR